MALFDCMVGVLGNQAMNALTTGETPKRMGNAHPNIVPYQDFPVADGHIIIACGNDRQFQKLCDILDFSPDFRTHYATNTARIAGRDALVEKISKATQNWSRESLLLALEEKSIPAGPINTVLEALNDPQIQARGLVDQSHKAPKVLNPIRFSNSSWRNNAAAPALNSGRKPG